MKCFLCDKPLENQRQKEVSLCKTCEVDTHGCSTGDCPHMTGKICEETIDALKAEQEGVSK